jgi:5-amino-6-(5-phosphoribosylamino)uracil reductase
VLLSAAVSLDGYLDDTSPTRLLLSNAEDFTRVDEVRATVDAILVGAGTVRADDPRLEVRSPPLRRRRLDSGRPETPLKVILSGTGSVGREARFLRGDGEKLIYVSSGAWRDTRDRIGSAAAVIDGGDPVDLGFLLADLAARGVDRLLVEGGGAVLTQFLAAGVVDELHLAVAPFLLGSAGGRRFVDPVAFPQNPARPMELAEVRAMGDVVLLRYGVNPGER